MMLSLIASEVWDQTDDWTGVTSPMERRKRQNRLNQRAYRKRRHIRRCAPIEEDTPVPKASTDSECHDVVIVGSTAPFSNSPTHPLDLITSPDIHHRLQVVDFVRRVLLNCSLRLQAPSEPHLLARLNVLSALITNAAMLNIPFQDLGREGAISRFNLQGPEPLGMNSTSLIPESLRPTALQREIVHSPWLDLFPMPTLRDSILQAFQESLLTQNQLCHSIFAVDDTGGAIAPLIVWGEPWDPSSWELCPQLLIKLDTLLNDCSTALESTNFWRKKRGETEIIRVQ
ncbi:hypothetical protein TWF970_000678 [Orbilia oligospora]|uniref:BZIP domain-containing protein n=1 Tax=Orbilia oligospora TaxID=2813651 RepID=A0A7C8RND7_ORBOL|nr:hypothetical protein TWF970_000678 [Orbilia oligospora]